jgi:glycosyltransferase involved in cell wall biosynthesis
VRSVLERPNAHTAFAYEAVAREHRKLGLPIPAGYSHAYNAKRLAREEAEYAVADLLACPSDFVVHTFLERDFDPARLVRHRYGYDPARFWPPRDGRPKSGRPFTVIFAGRCEPRKGLHYALQAWHESGAAKTGRFIICGSYLNGYREVLRPWLACHSIEERGFLNDVGETMRHSDVLVLSSVEEGSALVTYEGRACGCVLAVSEATGAVCLPGVDGLVHRIGDVDTLRTHFAELARHAERLEELRLHSIAGLADLSWTAAAGQLLTVYTCAPLTARASVGACE